MAERTAASPNSADVLYAVAKEELKKFEVGLKEASICSFPFPAIFRSQIYQ